MPNTALTSIESYYDLKKSPKLGRLQEKVLDIIKTHSPICNKDISDRFNLSINVVTPRVKELRELGLVKEDYQAIHPKTHKRVSYWGMKFNTKPVQATLWGGLNG